MGYIFTVKIYKDGVDTQVFVEDESKIHIAIAKVQELIRKKFGKKQRYYIYDIQKR